jgi:PTS system mannose-specific IIA component
MNKILIVAHAPLASALRTCALHVFPDLAHDLAALDVVASESVELSYQKASQALQSLDPVGTGQVLLLSDVFGATPCNIAQRLVNSPDRKLLAGVNLPMLLRAATYRQEGLEAMMSKALSGGIQGVMPVSISVPQNQGSRHHGQQHHYDQQ